MAVLEAAPPKLIVPNDVSPIQLVRKPENSQGQLELTEEGVDVLMNLTAPFAMVAAVGPTRTGKSSLLGRAFLSMPEIFEIGTGVHSHTTGIWITNKPVIIPTKRYGRLSVIFVDTEGFHGVQEKTSKTYENNLFAVSYLLSSTLIYNSAYPMDSHHVDELKGYSKTATNMAKTLEASGVHINRNPPDLLWVVQNFNFYNLNNSGMSGDDLLGNLTDSTMLSTLGMADESLDNLHGMFRTKSSEVSLDVKGLQLAVRAVTRGAEGAVQKEAAKFDLQEDRLGKQYTDEFKRWCAALQEVLLFTHKNTKGIATTHHQSMRAAHRDGEGNGASLARDHAVEVLPSSKNETDPFFQEAVRLEDDQTGAFEGLPRWAVANQRTALAPLFTDSMASYKKAIEDTLGQLAAVLLDDAEAAAHLVGMVDLLSGTLEAQLTEGVEALAPIHRPHNDDKVLANLGKHDDVELKREYIRDIRRLRDKIYSSLEPMQVAGVNIDGKEFTLNIERWVLYGHIQISEDSEGMHYVDKRMEKHVEEVLADYQERIAQLQLKVEGKGILPMILFKKSLDEVQSATLTKLQSRAKFWSYTLKGSPLEANLKSTISQKGRDMQRLYTGNALKSLAKYMDGKRSEAEDTSIACDEYRSNLEEK
eukprot:gene17470-20803_t